MTDREKRNAAVDQLSKLMAAGLGKTKQAKDLAKLIDELSRPAAISTVVAERVTAARIRDMERDAKLQAEQPSLKISNEDAAMEAEDLGDYAEARRLRGEDF